MKHFENICLLCLLFWCSNIFAQTDISAFDFGQDMNEPRVEIFYSQGTLSEDSYLQLRLQVDSGWSINSNAPGDDFLVPTTVNATATGITYAPTIYPTAQKEFIDALDMEISTFSDTFSIILPIAELKDDYDSISTVATLNYQACSQGMCLAPTEIEVKFSEQLGTSTLKKNSFKDEAPLLNTTTLSDDTANSKNRPTWLLMLLFAFIGGLILNLMPCVLPVLSIKVLSLTQQAQESRRRLLGLTFTMTAGVLISFWVLAGAIILVQTAGGHAGWGFQFQNPIFLLLMTILMVLFALNLFGVYEIWLPSSTQTGMGKLTSKSGFGGAFFNGVLMTLLATPCSAPFLGSAMGFAFSQPPLILFLFFTATALGLAFPFMIFAIFPRSLSWLPKPGSWMLLFKQFLGFLLMGTAVWLLWVLGKATALNVVVATLVLLLLLGFGAWIIGFLGAPGKKASHVLLSWLILVILALGGWFYAVQPALKQEEKAHTISSTDIWAKDAQGWHVWSPQLIQELQAQGKTIFVDFTADWCLTCKANELGVLSLNSIKELFNEFEVVMVKADWTKTDATIAQELRKHGRSGVPLYLVYGTGLKQALVLPEILTPDIIKDALLQAGPSMN